MKTLLHTCCGPCASACVPRLKEMDRDVTLLFANSNIDTREEFEKRFHEAEKLAAADQVKIVALPYDHEEWLREVAAGYENEPEKGARCARCFRYNLAKAAAYAAEHGYDEYTTSLTVSPHKDSKTIFSIAQSPIPNPQSPIPNPFFLPLDFKKKEGFKLSTKRAKELGLYRQSYCGCEFSKPSTAHRTCGALAARRWPVSSTLNSQPSNLNWRFHHKPETASTNLDARTGRHGDVYTADFQTAGRGRLDHKWLSPPGTNLMMSVALSVADLPPDQVATLPLVIGLAVAKAVEEIVSTPPFNPQTSTLNPQPCSLKWPNDILVDGKKLAGILCERQGDNVIVGIGVNVNQTKFPSEIADRATSLALILNPQPSTLNPPPTSVVRDALLVEIGRWYALWKTKGFSSVYPEIAKIDFLKGQTLSVRQTDDDAEPIRGICGGIQPDGSLAVGGQKVYAGEAHVKANY